MKTVKKHIRLLESGRYHLTTTIQGEPIRKTFDTIEEAENYIKELRTYNKIKNHDYPLDAIDIIFGNNSNIDIAYIEEHFDSNFMEVIKSFTEREQRIILKRIKEGYTLEAVALQENFSRERIRQIEARTIRRLRHPARIEMLRYGKEVKSLRDDIKKLEMELEAKKIEIMYQLKNPEMIKLTKEERLTTLSIVDLDLSVRAYRCLMRSGIDNIGLLITKTEDDLSRIRNLGRKSMKEIKQKLEENGYCLREDSVYQDKEI